MISFLFVVSFHHCHTHRHLNIILFMASIIGLRTFKVMYCQIHGGVRQTEKYFRAVFEALKYLNFQLRKIVKPTTIQTLPPTQRLLKMQPTLRRHKLDVCAFQFVPFPCMLTLFIAKKRRYLSVCLSTTPRRSMGNKDRDPHVLIVRNTCR